MDQSPELRIAPDHQRDGDYMDAPCRIPLAVKTFNLQGDISIRMDVAGNREMSNCLQAKDFVCHSLPMMEGH